MPDLRVHTSQLVNSTENAESRGPEVICVQIEKRAAAMVGVTSSIASVSGQYRLLLCELLRLGVYNLSGYSDDLRIGDAHGVPARTDAPGQPGALSQRVEATRVRLDGTQASRCMSVASAVTA